MAWTAIDYTKPVSSQPAIIYELADAVIERFEICKHPNYYNPPIYGSDGTYLPHHPYYGVNTIGGFDRLTPQYAKEQNLIAYLYQPTSTLCNTLGTYLRVIRDSIECLITLDLYAPSVNTYPIKVWLGGNVSYFPLYLVNGAISRTVTDTDNKTLEHGVASAYVKEDGSPFSDLQELLGLAGVGTEWIEDRAVSNYNVILQIRKCIDLLRRYVVYVKPTYEQPTGSLYRIAYPNSFYGFDKSIPYSVMNETVWDWIKTNTSYRKVTIRDYNYISHTFGFGGVFTSYSFFTAEVVDLPGLTALPLLGWEWSNYQQYPLTQVGDRFRPNIVAGGILGPNVVETHNLLKYRGTPIRMDSYYTLEASNNFTGNYTVTIDDDYYSANPGSSDNIEYTLIGDHIPIGQQYQRAIACISSIPSDLPFSSPNNANYARIRRTCFDQQSVELKPTRLFVDATPVLTIGEIGE